MQIYRYLILFFFLFGLGTLSAQEQEEDKLAFFEAADSFHTARFWTSFGVGASSYTAAIIGLHRIWYAEFPRTKFHLFNDWEEWEKMDKVGHFFSAYQEARGTFELLHWTGAKRRNALILGSGLSVLFQTSLEVLDGYSEEWGFSLYDAAFNTLGTGVFVAQDLIWKEQRITFKISSFGVPYPNTVIYATNGNESITLKDRAKELYGTSALERFVKDYNGQTTWISVNVYDFMKTESRFPKWLNVAVGIGAQNLYGGTDNIWESGESTFVVDPVAFPRYQQYYLSLDVDLTKIKTKSHFLRTVFKTLNFIKIPAPALEINSLGKAKFHPLHY